MSRPIRVLSGKKGDQGSAAWLTWSCAAFSAAEILAIAGFPS
jgi:hypothetical protein